MTQLIAPVGELQQLVLDPDSFPLGRLHSDLFLSRLAGALRAFEANDGTTGKADIGGLVRQGLLRCACGRGEAPEIRVRKGGQWLSDFDWKVFGCDARPVGVDHFVVHARNWAPSWLDPGASEVVDAALRGEQRRAFHGIPTDPAVAEYAMVESYVSAGQREAVHAAFFLEPGTTAIINLPTGGGKTLAFQLPALVSSEDCGLTLVITPTVALARDQETRFYQLLEQRFPGHRALGTPLAYHGGLDDAGKAALRRGISIGELPIVFASPEAALGGLRGPLFEAAERGRLRVLAIDEAHIVSQWGQQFRPEFQSLAGLRNALLAKCPLQSRFRTLLLTATLTTETFRVLKMLFGREGCEVVSEATLRPEPGFLLSSAGSEEERGARVFEATNRLPRPLLLYTTEREHALRWYERLWSAGYRRIRLVRGGDLSEPSGERILAEWRQGAVDMIVATSAFGLGVDQADVRSVIHACLPESVDRFYQEVGRAGRDGRAAVSLLISVPGDRQVAEALAQERLISAQRGFERWEAMWRRVVRQSVYTNDSYVLSLDDRPPDLPTTNERNVAWNLRTLVLMAQAGLIEFTAHEPPEIIRLPAEDDDSYSQRWRDARDRFSRHVAIKVRDDRLHNREHWEFAVERTRTVLREQDQSAFQKVLELLNPGRPINDLFREVYTVANPPIRPPRLLGSCPVTRREQMIDFRMDPPELTTLERPCASLSGPFQKALAPCRDNHDRMWVLCETAPIDRRDLRRWRGQILTLLRHAVSSGVAELALPHAQFNLQEWGSLLAQSPYGFIIQRDIMKVSKDFFSPELFVPRLSLLSASGNDLPMPVVNYTLQTDRPGHVIVAPPTLGDPNHPHRRLLDTRRHMSIGEVLSRLEV